MSDGLAVRLAAWLDGLRWDALPARQRELAPLRVLDTLGLVARGAAAPAGRTAHAFAARNAAAGDASVAGGGRLAPMFAALVHGVAAHCYDFDDTFPDSVVHPGSALVPAALAVGEAAGASGAEVATALAGGYELACRLAAAGERRFHERGFHASGIFAPVSSAFVAARLMRLPPERAAWAVGLAASTSGGLLAFLPDGAWSKWLHLGWGSAAGIAAAELARDGFRGPLGALDGRHNLFEAFVGLDPAALAPVEDGLGTEWRNERAAFKLYPCAHVIQPYLDLALALRGELGAETAARARVTCAVAPWAVAIVCEPRAEKVRPASMLVAIASLPFLVAAALLDGRVGLETIAEERLRRPDVLALAERVGYAVEPGLEGFAAELTLETADGRTVRRGGRAAEAGAARLHEKFVALATGAAAPQAVQHGAAAAIGLGEAPDLGGIAAFLRALAPASGTG